MLNIRSLNSKVDDLISVCRDQQIDVLLLTETWHDSDSVSIARLRQSFNVAERARPRLPSSDQLSTNHGGIAVVCLKTIQLKVLNLPTKVSSFEYICVRISTGPSSVVVLLVYRTGLVSTQFFEELSDALDRVIILSDSLIIAGDMNIHVERPEDANALKLLRTFESYGLSCKVNVPTHNLGGTLDVVFTSANTPLAVRTHETGLSDHSLLLWNSTLPRPPLVYYKSSYRQWNRLDSEKFFHLLSCSKLCDSHSWSSMSIDELSHFYRSSLLQILDELIPVRTVRRPERKSDPWFDEDCRRAKRYARWIERLYGNLCSRNSNAANIVLVVWKNALRRYRSLLNCKRSQFWQRKVSSVTDSKELWRHFDSLMGRCRPTASCSVTAEEFLQFFTQKVDNVRSETASSSKPSLQQCPADCSFSAFRTFNENSVMCAIRKLSNKFSSSDPIPTRLLKDCSFLLAPFIVMLFNRCLTDGAFPQSWKVTRMKPVPKRGCTSPDEPSSYRPIAQVPVLAKILEKAVANQLWEHIDFHNLLPCHQSAYRRSHSTETALLKIVSDLLMSMDSGRVSLAASLDLTAAFDSIDHDILLLRLHRSFGISGVAFEWINSYLQSRYVSVIHNNIYSSSRPFNCGVPQGSVLGPLLFLIYVSDIPRIMRGFNFEVHQFADDIIIYGSCVPSSLNELSENLSSCIDSVNECLKSNRLLLNASKSKVMWCFSSRSKFSVPSVPIRVCNQMLTPVKHIRYLGLVIDSELNFQSHITHSVSSCFSTLRRIRSIRHLLTFAAARTLVSSLVLPRVDYCLSVLSGLPYASLNRLQRILHAAARLTFSSNRYEHVTPLLRELDWLPIRGRIERRIGILCFLCLHDLAPAYLTSGFRLVSSLPSRSRHRSAKSKVLVIPTFRRPSFGGRSFSVHASKFWNSLPPDIRCAASLNIFTNLLQNHLSSIYA